MITISAVVDTRAGTVIKRCTQRPDLSGNGDGDLYRPLIQIIAQQGIDLDIDHGGR